MARSNKRPPRRQIGADKRTMPASPLAGAVPDRTLIFAWIAIVVTACIWIGYFISTVVTAITDPGASRLRYIGEAATYTLVMTLLTGSAIAYLCTRLAFFKRSQKHARIPRAELDEFLAGDAPSTVVLVPSFREETRVIRQTLLSAALQEYPDLRIVLLIDDPPDPIDAEHQALLEQARALPARIEAVLRPIAATFQRRRATFQSRVAKRKVTTRADMRDLAASYSDAADAAERLVANLERRDHTDDFLADHIIGRVASDFRVTGHAILAAEHDGVMLGRNRMLQLYNRLVWTFDARITAFERKRYLSLSNEPNKAMNLNSYIGLMGTTNVVVEDFGGQRLRPANSGETGIEVPDADFVLTLDADSMLLPEYCMRLVYFLTREENAKVAVAQTPYSSLPGAGTRLERIAGATTDLQHIVHQGLTAYDATFWVGANAVLRKAALNQLVEIEHDGANEIRRYILDRTVIEDTESSIDLAVHGWSLYNYPERLSYSATPPDFGALCIQRQRWANGGLLIVPKLLRHLRKRRANGNRARTSEALLRLNYLASISWSTVGLIILLAYPYQQRLLSRFVLVAAVPYFMAMASDLRRCGYKRVDVLRVYGFNLLLLPVNLAGTLKSISQAITATKSPFARTPKVRERTTAPLSFVLIPYLLVVFSALTLVRDIRHNRWAHAVYAGANATLAFYAIVAFIGIRHSIVDLVLNLGKFLIDPVKTHSSEVTPAPTVLQSEWAKVLYQGSDSVPASWTMFEEEAEEADDPRMAPVPTEHPPLSPSPVSAKADAAKSFEFDS